MRLCSHVITSDSGLAPNPFHGYCTSALCTPSHVRARLKPGDWLIGHSRKNEGNRLVYAMRISEVLLIDQYFRDARFERKKPKPEGTLDEQYGDNIYYKDNTDQWKRLPSRLHNDRNSFIKDVGSKPAGCPVFVSDHFYYFGSQRVAIPDEFAKVIQKRQGLHYTSDRWADDFVTWLKDNHELGILGMPRDRKDRSHEEGGMITDLIDDGAAQTKNQECGDCRPKSRAVTETLARSRGCH